MVAHFVHIGDIHAAPGPRNVDRFRALDQIIDESVALSAASALAAFLIPGDLFDALSTPEDRNALDLRIQRMARYAAVVICQGNHDRDGELEGFARLERTWPIVVVTSGMRPQCVRIPLACAAQQHATIFVLPYPSKAGLVAAGVSVGDVVNVAGDLLEPIFIAAAAELEAAKASGDLVLMMGHINVAGSIVSTGQPQIGHEIELSPKHLERLGRIPKLLNHIHKPQQAADAFYAGSICRQSYGEIEAKRYLVVGVSDGGWAGFSGDGPWSGDAQQAFDIMSKPIDVPPMLHIDGRLSVHGFTVDSRDEAHDEEIHRRLEANDWAGIDLRVRYTYPASLRGVLDHASVRARFQGALRLKVESVAEADRDMRAPLVAVAKTLEEKLAAFRQEGTLAPSLVDKLAQLQRQDHAQVLAYAAARLTAVTTPQETVAA